MRVREKEVVTQYLSFLRTGFRCEAVGDRYRIVTPFLTPDNDPIIVYVSQGEDGSLCLSDGGRVVEFLFLAGLEPEGDEALAHKLRAVARGGRVEFVDGELLVTIGAEGVGAAFHRLLRVLRGAYDLIHVAHVEPLLAAA